jgi:ATP-dependent exoDNAse (exonuclease V) beta subunit
MEDAQRTARIINNLVHRALALWCFPDEPRCQRVLQTACFEAGLVNPSQRASAIQHAEKLLMRLRAHPLWEQIETSIERYHEVPYTLASGKSGCIDLIYRLTDGWRLIDFKTEALSTQAELDKAIQAHLPQMQHHRQAISHLLAFRPNQPFVNTSLVFLDYQGKVIDK